MTSNHRDGRCGGEDGAMKMTGWRDRPPTEAERLAHGGRWDCLDCDVRRLHRLFWHDDYMCFVSEKLGALFITQGDAYLWRPIDDEGNGVPWPAEAPATTETPMACNPTTPGSGRWTCETCGADLCDFSKLGCKLASSIDQCPQGHDLAFRTGPHLYQHCNPPTARDDGPPAERKAVPDFARCPDAKRLHPVSRAESCPHCHGWGDDCLICDHTGWLKPLDEPAPSDYNRAIADAVAAVTGSLARARARRAPIDVIDVLYDARDAVAALKRGSE